MCAVQYLTRSMTLEEIRSRDPTSNSVHSHKDHYTSKIVIRTGSFSREELNCSKHLSQKAQSLPWDDSNLQTFVYERLRGGHGVLVSLALLPRGSLSPGSILTSG